MQVNNIRRQYSGLIPICSKLFVEQKMTSKHNLKEYDNEENGVFVELIQGNVPHDEVTVRDVILIDKVIQKLRIVCIILGVEIYGEQGVLKHPHLDNRTLPLL